MNRKRAQLRVNNKRFLVVSGGILGILFSVNPLSAQSCKYDKNGVENPPFVWMLNRLEAKTVRQIKGKISDSNEEPIPGAVVSVFELTQNGAKFIGSDETDFKGRYCFGGLKKGKYEIRIGHRYFQRYDLVVNLEPKNKKAEIKMEFTLEVGY